MDMDEMVRDFVAGFVKASADGRRLGSVQPYEAGREAAMRKFASPLGLPGKLDLLGLGMLGAPLIHDLVTDGREESPFVRRTKKITELAGLATLAASTLSH